jgi:hypothetical protein
MTNSADKTPKQENVQQQQGVHGEAADQHGGHSGEGAASAMAHMINQDQKHRRQSVDSNDDSRNG